MFSGVVKTLDLPTTYKQTVKGGLKKKKFIWVVTVPRYRITDRNQDQCAGCDQDEPCATRDVAREEGEIVVRRGIHQMRILRREAEITRPKIH